MTPELSRPSTEGEAPHELDPPWAGSQRASYVDGAARRAFALDGVPDLSALPEIFVRPPSGAIFVVPGGPEGGRRKRLHAVGVAGGDPGPGGEPPIVEIEVLAADSAIALLLMSPMPVVWKLEVKPGASLAAVLTSGNAGSMVQSDAPLPLLGSFPEGPAAHGFATSGQALGRLGLLRYLEYLTRTRLASFQGGMPGSRFSVPPWKEKALVVEVFAKHLDLLIERSSPPPGPFWLVNRGFVGLEGSGDEPYPVPSRETKAAAFCEVDRCLYTLSKTAIHRIDEAGRVEVLVPPDALRLSALGGIAYDSRRRRVLVTTTSAEASHGAFDPRTWSWSALDVSRGGVIHGLAYEATRDLLFGFGADGLARFSPDLEALGPIPLAEALPVPDPGRREVAIQMAAFPDSLVVCFWDEQDEQWLRGNRAHVTQVEAGFLVRLDSGELRILHGTAQAEAEPDGSVWIADLQRRTRDIVDWVSANDGVLRIAGRGVSGVSMVGFRRYHGLAATFEELRYPDWRTRLARAKREIAANLSTTPEHLPGWARVAPLRWTEQATELCASVPGSLFIPLSAHLRQVAERPSLSLPMAGPFAGYEAFRLPAAGWLILRRDGECVWVAYLRLYRELPRPVG